MNRRRTTKLATNRSQLRQEMVKRRDYRRLFRSKLECMFPDNQSRTRAVKVLEGYGGDRPEAHRVRLAILKLSETDLSEIQRHMEGALEDYEDIIGWAESPRRMKAAIGNRKLTPKEREQSSTADRKEFETSLLTSKQSQRP